MPALDRGPQRRSLAQHVLLPDQLVERPRPHPHGQGRIGWNRRPRALFAAFEQAICH
jgi:hypothetical protein